ncbi:MAG: ribosome-associated translation inhibitor RaiA [Spirochaetes bacterium]|nr:MAG: ribosome-associated translation inhibitor RaiA [Spirochaetota bacterium]
MKITLTGRHVEVTDSLRDYAGKKVAKFEKYFHQLIDSYMILSVEKLDHVVELLINGDGVQFYAVEKSGDMYSSIDLLVDKMEKQVVKYKEKHTGHKVVPLSTIMTAEPASPQMKELLLNQVSNKPKDEIEAYLEMKLDNMNCILFKKGMKDAANSMDFLNKNYALIYRNGMAVKMIEIPVEMIKANSFDSGRFVEWDLMVHSDSPADPKIELKKCGSPAKVENLSIAEALERFTGSGAEFMPFFNNETNYLNLIYKKGKNLEIMVPAF